MAGLLLLTVPAFADPVISEFLADNVAGLADEDGAHSDWVELHNPDAAALNLDGWFLTDNAGSPLKWRTSQNIRATGVSSPRHGSSSKVLESGQASMSASWTRV